ncbi:MAG: polysaccharide deacetylase family protein [Symbiobacteriia bacterium]
MDREGKAHFGVYRVNRVALLIIGLVLVAVATYKFNPLQKVMATVWHTRSQAGVTLQGQDVSGKDSAQLRAIVQQLAQTYNQPAVEAVADPAHKGGVLPDLNAATVDVEKTVAGILQQPAGGRAGFVFSEQSAVKTVADFKEAPVYSGNPGKSAVALAVQVAGNGTKVPEMLQALKDFGVQTTFFVSGAWADKHPEEFTAIVAAGHEVASRGYSDTLDPAQATAAELKADLEKAVSTLNRLSGGAVAVQLYTPREGSVSSAVAKTAFDKGLRTVMWNVDTADWTDVGADAMTARVLKAAKKGAIVLMHPRDNTVAAIRDIVAGLEEKGLDVVPVSDLISPQRYPRAAAVTQPESK